MLRSIFLAKAWKGAAERQTLKKCFLPAWRDNSRGVHDPANQMGSTAATRVQPVS
jgi:hypothetical protein